MTPRAPSRRDWGDLLAAPGVPGDAGARRGAFLDLRVTWGGATDLFGGGEPASVLDALVRDTLAALPWVPASGRLVDVGSGNGFPAVPLLIARPGLSGALLEPRERRWAFLKEAVRETGVEAEVVRERVGEHGAGGYDVGTVRGVDAAAWEGEAARLLAPGGTWLWWTSAAKASEWRRRAGGERVVTFALPGGGQATLAVWR